MPLLDLYERKARLTPGLLAVAPLPIAIATFGLKKYPAVAIAGAVLVAAGGTYLLAVIVGNLGRAAQNKMERAWGCLPTTELLRTRSSATNDVQRDLWREALTKLTGVRLLSQADETADSKRADDTITAAVGQVLPLGHGGGNYPLVAAENAQFGLERNVYGFRWIARLIASVCCLVLVAALFVPSFVSRAAVIAGLIIDLLILLAWIVIPSAERTHAAGFRYAKQLLNAVAKEAASKSGTTSPQGGTP